MLNISLKSINKSIDRSKYKSFKSIQEKSKSNLILKVLIGLLVISIACLFLPWTQNIRTKGYVTTLNAYDKPQDIQALVGGKIEKWFVKEGDVVNIGDTIAVLTEAKAEYFDPKLLANTKEQQIAKQNSADSYSNKLSFLKEQLVAVVNFRNSKLQQIDIKREQIDLEISSTKLDLEAAKTYLDNANNQLERMEKMYDQGIKSLTDLETKRLSSREAEAKMNSYSNKLDKHLTEKQNLLQEIDLVNADYEQKSSKIESEVRSAESYRFSLLGETNKLQSKFNKIEQRQSAFVISSPISGRITKVLKNGIGEFVKEQESLVTIVPLEYQKAVGLFVEPNDMPLVKPGKKVRMQFDGWPAVVFSGWPNNSFGTFGGTVYAVDDDISENGKYRIIIVEDDSEKSWPDLIRIGSGVRGLLLLNDVKVYYEIWRQLNGFPPDFYEPQDTKEIKSKAPIRKIK